MRFSASSKLLFLLFLSEGEPEWISSLTDGVMAVKGLIWIWAELPSSLIYAGSGWKMTVFFLLGPVLDPAGVSFLVGVWFFFRGLAPSVSWYSYCLDRLFLSSFAGLLLPSSTLRSFSLFGWFPIANAAASVPCWTAAFS